MKISLTLLGILILLIFTSCEWEFLFPIENSEISISFHNNTEKAVILEWAIQDSIPKKTSLMPFSTGKDSELLYHEVSTERDLKGFTQDEFSEVLSLFSVSVINRQDTITNSEGLRSLDNWTYDNYLDRDSRTEIFGYTMSWN